MTDSVPAISNRKRAHYSRDRWFWVALFLGIVSCVFITLFAVEVRKNNRYGSSPASAVYPSSTASMEAGRLRSLAEEDPMPKPDEDSFDEPMIDMVSSASSSASSSSTTTRSTTLEAISQCQSQNRPIVGSLLFDQYEPLDVYGPWEMFLMASYCVVTCSLYDDREQVQIRNNVLDPLVNNETHYVPDYGPATATVANFRRQDCPYDQFDVVHIPGTDPQGYYSAVEHVRSAKVSEWLVKLMQTVPVMFTVCSGSGILAASGALNGYQATTNKLLHNTIQYHTQTWFADSRPDWICDAQWVRDDQRSNDESNGTLFYSSSGVSAGTQASLQLIYELSGFDKAAFSAGLAEFVLNGNGQPFTEGGTEPFPRMLGDDPFAYHCSCDRTDEEVVGNCSATGNFQTNNNRCICPPGVGLDYLPKECEVPGECKDAVGGTAFVG